MSLSNGSMLENRILFLYTLFRAECPLKICLISAASALRTGSLSTDRMDDFGESFMKTSLGKRLVASWRDLVDLIDIVRSIGFFDVIFGPMRAIGPLIVPNFPALGVPLLNLRATSCAAYTMKIIEGKETEIISKPQNRT